MGVRVQIENFGDIKGVRYQLLTKNYTYSSHIHQFAELFVVLDGELEITVEGVTERMTPNTAALVFPFQAHKYYSKMINRVAIFVFSDSILPEFSIVYEGKVSDRSVFNLSDSTLSALRDRIIDAKDYDVFDLKGCLYFAIQDFLRQVELKPTSKKPSLPVERILNYVINHITESITLESVANELGYSPKYLSNLISKLFDMNFSTLVANIRVDRARHLLRETKKTRSEICYECGFGSERSFHRQFRKIMNYSPDQYRKMNFGTIKQGSIRTFK